MGEGFGFMKGFKQAGHGIFTHSRPDKIGTPYPMSRRPRLLPLDIRDILNGLSAKESAQIPYPACFNWFNPEGK
jgi:hypothetical protein